MRAAVNKYGNFAAKVYILEDSTSEILRSFGNQVYSALKSMMLYNGINVISNTYIKEIKIDSFESDRITSLVISSSDKGVDSQLNLDLVISENDIESSKMNLHNIYNENPEKPQPFITEKNVVYVDNLHSLMYKHYYPTIFAAGSCSALNSELNDNMVRCQDPHFEVDTGFYAGLSMMHKRIGYKDVPISTFTLANNFYAYIGERNPIYTDIIIEGNLKANQFVVYLYNLEKTSKQVDRRSNKKSSKITDSN